MPSNYAELLQYPFYKEMEKGALIYVHIPKNAGTSIARALEMPRSGGKPDIKKHYPADQIQMAIDPDLWAKAFRFCFVRNPWDRTFSHYRYRVRKGRIDEESHRDSFEAWLRYEFQERRRAKNNLRPQLHWIRNTEGVVDMSFIGRFERLQEDFAHICDHFQIQASLPHKLASHPKLDYRDQYTEEMAAIVQEFFREDIEYFGYRF